MANDFALHVLLALPVIINLSILVGSLEGEIRSSPLMANYSADVMLGALFPIHEATSNYSDCGRIQVEDGIQLLEALLFTIDNINKQGLLPGFRLGVMILDSCDSVPHALEQSLDFIKGFISKYGEHHDDQFVCNDGSPAKYRGKEFGRVIGVIGGQSSQVSIQVANLLRIFHIPQISYLSTSPTLSNKELFGYFFRTVPSDINQVETILEILKAFEWTYVSLVYTNTDYGNKGVEELEKFAPKYKVCFATSQRINVEQYQEIDYDRVIQNLFKTSAKVVVMFADKKSARRLMAAVKRQQAVDRFVWIGSDGWSRRDTVVQGLEEVIEGAITVLPMWGRLNGFDEYFTNLRPNHQREENPWFDEFWEEYFQCRLTDRPPTRYSAPYNECQPDLSISTSSGYRQQTYLHFVRDAAYAFAYAVRDMHRDKCGEVHGICKAMKEVLDGRQLKRYLSNVTFKDELNQTFRFQQNGDGPPRYSILNYQKLKPGVYDWVEVGSYLLEGGRPQLKINKTKMKFVDGNSEYPTSYCSEPCRQDQAKIQQEGETCCWVCTNCSTYQIRPDEFHCQECPLGTLPDPNKGFCETIPEEYVDYSNPWAIAAMAIAGLGLLLTVGIGLIFGVYSDTPIIKAAGRELSYILLIGIFFSFAMTFVIVAKPTPLFCGIGRFFLGFCYTLCYSAIVTKTNRIARIFNSKNSTPRKTRYISPQSQVIITVLLTLVEVIINMAWLVIYPPNAILVYPSREENLLICAGSDNASYLVGLIYPFVLICFCTVYAFKTRKCPDGFNEARYVAFTNYTTCVLWLAFVPLFFSSSNNVQRTITLSISLTLAATVQLGCLFLPKIHTVLFKPEKNTKEGVMSQHRSCYLPSSSLAPATSPTFLLNGSCLEGDRNGQRLNSTTSSLAGHSSISDDQSYVQPTMANNTPMAVATTNGQSSSQDATSTQC